MLRKKCFRCKGSRTIVALGCLTEKCNECDGTGYELVPESKELDEFLYSSPLKEKPKEEELETLPVEVIKETKKKMGRPAKAKPNV